MSRIELEAERDDLKRRIEELERILASDEALDGVVIDEMDDAVAKYGTPRRTVLLDEDEEGNLTPVVAHGDDGVSANAMAAARAAATVSSAAADVAAAAKAAKKAGDENATASALQIDDEPCAVMLSATGLIARTSEDAVERWENRSASDGRAKDDQIVSMFRTSTRSSYGLVTSAGRLVLAHVVELPKVSADGPLSVTGGVKAEELLGMTENTDPIRGERVIAAIDMPSTDDGGQLVPLALGTRNGVVKRWNRESPTTMDSWSVHRFLVVDVRSEECASAGPYRWRHGGHSSG